MTGRDYVSTMGLSRLEYCDIARSASRASSVSIVIFQILLFLPFSVWPLLAIVAFLVHIASMNRHVRHREALPHARVSKLTAPAGTDRQDSEDQSREQGQSRDRRGVDQKKNHLGQELVRRDFWDLRRKKTAQTFLIKCLHAST